MSYIFELQGSILAVGIVKSSQESLLGGYGAAWVASFLALRLMALRAEQIDRSEFVEDTRPPSPGQQPPGMMEREGSRPSHQRGVAPG